MGKGKAEETAKPVPGASLPFPHSVPATPGGRRGSAPFCGGEAEGREVRGLQLSLGAEQRQDSNLAWLLGPRSPGPQGCSLPSVARGLWFCPRA